MQLSDGAWNRIDELLDAAWDLDPDERAPFLAEECAGEPEIRSEVETLLEAEAEVPDFLEGDAATFAGPAYAEAVEDGELTHVDRWVGPYRLGEEIGRGGMSRIFRAERVDGGFEQEVAVKLLRLGLDSEEARQRFRLERQVLATLDHPNIAQLLDGGLTEDGVPYLVMEYVDGLPLTDFCNAHRCTLDERLSLLATVGEALQYAHRNLVVHRDLKPSNILVSDDGEVQLLDFGIAKLLDADVAGFTVPPTRTGIRPMTPAYAAPEQVRGQPVSAATDVYQLGVLAYELLTGHRPYEAEGRSPFEVEQAVIEEAPTRPSTVVKKTSEQEEGEPQRISVVRGTTPGELARMLRGDLDAILLKALRKDPEQRYASTDALVADLERYEQGQPVQARSITPSYRLRKFVGRHRGGVLASVAGLLVVIGFVTLLLYQRGIALDERDRARTEAQTSEQVSGFLVELFEASNPMTETEEVTAQDVLQRGRQRIGQLNDQPAVQAGLLDAMGRAYRGLGRYDTARTLLRRSLQRRREVYAPDHPDVAMSLDHLADLFVAERDVEPAVPLYRRAHALRRQALGPSHPKTAETMEGLAGALRNMGKPDSSVALARRALAVHRAHRDSTHPDVIEAEHTLAYALRAAGRYEEGAALYRTVLEKEQARYGPEHPALAGTHNDLAYLLKRQGNSAAAVRHYRQALDIRRSVLGPAHPKTLLILQNLAGVLWEQEKYGEVEAVLRERVEVLETHAPADSSRLGTAVGALARFLAERGQFTEAVGPMRDAYRIYRSQYGSGNLYTLCRGAELGAVLKALGQDREADLLLRRHRDSLQTRRDTILKTRDTYVRLDVVHNLRAIITVFEQAGLKTLARRYRPLYEAYQSTPES